MPQLNRIIRTLRVAEANFSVRRHVFLSSAEAANWAEKKNMFFVLSHGRSGTNFLADLLNHAERTLVVHEPHQVDDCAIELATYNPTATTTYINDFRQKDIYLRARDANIDTYGEVNSLLRRHVQELQETFPHAHYIHLIRDGRDVVRSMLTRDTLTLRDSKTAHLIPPSDDPYLEQWSIMSRFEQLCWYWQHENKLLMKHLDKYVKFEFVTTDYNYFQEELLDSIGVRLSKATWEEEVNIPKNHTRGQKAPHWREWTREETEAFWRICGDVMEAFDYV